MKILLTAIILSNWLALSTAWADTSRTFSCEATLLRNALAELFTMASNPTHELTDEQDKNIGAYHEFISGCLSTVESDPQLKILSDLFVEAVFDRFKTLVQ